MPVTRVISLNNGIQTEVVPATTSAGSSSAGQLVALNTSGLVDSSMLPTSGSSGPSMSVPRDVAWKMANGCPPSNGFQYLGIYSGNSVYSIVTNNNADAAGFNSVGMKTTATSGAVAGFVSINDSKFISPSFHCIYGLPSITSINAYIGLSNYCSPNVASSDPGTSGVVFAGFRYSSAIDGSNWQAYLSDGTHTGATADTGVAVNTTQCQVFDVIWVSGVPQWYINGTQVATGISTAHIPATTASMGVVAVHQTTTAAVAQANLNMIYYGTNY